MTERLAEVSARITGMQQLGAVVSAMRGIAAARAQQARAQLGAVDGYAGAIGQAIASALALMPPSISTDDTGDAKPALVLYCAEQGFVGAFNERIIDAVRDSLADTMIFALGSRGVTKLGELAIPIAWSAAMPTQPAHIPKFADHVADAVYAHIVSGSIDRLDVAYMQHSAGRGSDIVRRRLFPIDPAAFASKAISSAPLLNLPPAVLLDDFTADYVHAQLCQAALHGFAAENEARMQAMAAAHRHLDARLLDLQAIQRQVRQAEITDEIIELTSGIDAAAE